MKYCYVLVLALLIAGCKKPSHIEITGTVSGVNNGVFIIKTVNDSTVFNAPIKAGKFTIDTTLAQPGYYLMVITNAILGTQVFDIYLEDGKYTIATNSKSPFKYPNVQSSSTIAKDLAAYYHLSGEMSEALLKKLQRLNAQIAGAKAKSLPIGSLQAQFNAGRLEEDKLSSVTLNAFVDKHPETEIVPHIMLNMNYQNDPAAFNRVYQKLSPASKNSPAGKQLAHWLDYYLKHPVVQ